MSEYLFVIIGVSFLIYSFAKIAGNVRITVILDRRLETKDFTRTGFCVKIPNPMYPDTKFLSDTSVTVHDDLHEA